jgi:hypothetical protein
MNNRATLVFPTVVNSAAASVAFYIPLEIAKASTRWEALQGISVTSIKTLSLFFFLTSYIVLHLLLVVPTEAILIRVAVSILPTEATANVPLDPALSKAGFTPGPFEAWNSFGRTARARYYKAHMHALFLRLSLWTSFAGFVLVARVYFANW